MDAVSVVHNAVDRCNTPSGEISQLMRFVTSNRHDPRHRSQLGMSPTTVTSERLTNRVKDTHRHIV